MTTGPNMEMLFVRPTRDDDDTRERIATFAATLGGVVLMSTDGGALVLGMPPGYRDAVAAHGCAAFVGGVSFADDGPGVAALQQRFALNAARQLAANGATWIGESTAHPAPELGRAPWLPSAAPPPSDNHHLIGRAPWLPIRPPTN